MKREVEDLFLQTSLKNAETYGTSNGEHLDITMVIAILGKDEGEGYGAPKKGYFRIINKLIGRTSHVSMCKGVTKGGRLLPFHSLLTDDKKIVPFRVTSHSNIIRKITYFNQ